LLDDVGVGADQVVAAHPRLAGDSGRDDHQFGSGRQAVVIRPDDARIEAFDRCGLVLVEGFPLRDTFDDIDQDDGTGELFFGEALGGGGADVAGANDGDLGEQGVGKLMTALILL